MLYQVTPDGRYFVVQGRLWRCSNPSPAEPDRQKLVDDLMAAHRAVGVARRAQDARAEQWARGDVDRAKRGLGERGTVWWKDGALDFNRHFARNTPYAAWFAALEPASSA